jgi:hypothetical protein
VLTAGTVTAFGLNLLPRIAYASSGIAQYTCMILASFAMLLLLHNLLPFPLCTNIYPSIERAPNTVYRISHLPDIVYKYISLYREHLILFIGSLTYQALSYIRVIIVDIY